MRERGARFPLVFDPGDKWDYGINIDWVGKAVERVSGRKLGDYFAELVFAPLGKMPQEPEFEMGGGGLYGTAADYLAFARLFLNEGRADGGAAVLKPETVRLMTQKAIGGLEARLLKSAAPAYSNDAEFFPGMVKK